jgi:hypothetical protein
MFYLITSSLFTLHSSLFPRSADIDIRIESETAFDEPMRAMRARLAEGDDGYFVLSAIDDAIDVGKQAHDMRVIEAALEGAALHPCAVSLHHRGDAAQSSPVSHIVSDDD